MMSRTSQAVTSRLSQISNHLKPQARSISTLRLNTGASIPAIGFGTWQDKDAQEAAVTAALRAGYRHIDTARIYGTEPAVAAAIKNFGIPREELFITTKLWNNSHHPDDVEAALDASLKDLGTNYVDLYLMHWPSPFQRGEKPFPRDADGKVIPGDTDYVDTYKAMEKLQTAGKARAIGISNFSLAELKRILAEVSIVPAVHQMELHPYLQQKSFMDFHRQNNIHVTQYSPFGNQNEIYDSGKGMAKLMDDPVLVEIGKKYGKTGAQVALAWGIAHGRTVIPKSKTPSRIEANFAGDFTLEENDVKAVDDLDRKLRFADGSRNFGWNFYADLDGKKAENSYP
ncbi:hypothetical protein MMC25_006551 [Agyrium rufum]|nr:hypothetical protein [Agyrium rufum]